MKKKKFAKKRLSVMIRTEMMTTMKENLQKRKMDLMLDLLKKARKKPSKRV